MQPGRAMDSIGRQRYVWAPFPEVPLDTDEIFSFLRSVARPTGRCAVIALLQLAAVAGTLSVYYDTTSFTGLDRKAVYALVLGVVFLILNAVHRHWLQTVSDEALRLDGYNAGLETRASEVEALTAYRDTLHSAQTLLIERIKKEHPLAGSDLQLDNQRIVREISDALAKERPMPTFDWLREPRKLP